MTLHKMWLQILTLPKKLARKMFSVCMVPFWIWSQKWLKLSQKVTNLCSICRLENVSHMRLSKIWVTTITRSVEKILAAKKMLQPPTTLVPKFAGIQQLSNHVCHDVGISYSFASYQGFSPIFSLKTAHFRWSETESLMFELKNDRYPLRV